MCIISSKRGDQGKHELSSKHDSILGREENEIEG